MNNSFKCYIDSATAQKRLFDESIDNVKDSLVKAVAESSRSKGNEAPLLNINRVQPTYSTTGWLKGALSYPWAIVTVVIPSILQDIF